MASAVPIKIATVIKSSPNLEKIHCNDKEFKIKNCGSRLQKRMVGHCLESECSSYKRYGDSESGKFSLLQFLLKYLNFKYKAWKFLKGLLAPCVGDSSVC
ncbi:hypothetical protein L798_05949 [Zootermopsis nevadensis]|uniref:Uncharacterized protein n=1 Tax=Zootermopsis nevadensis TaxID=136037 RepID=A0A067RKI2_ZOONE|nr:hypothetical protein L798_05949 [Zootermopsis nevadensis]